MTARAVVANLLETDPDDFDPREAAARYMETVDFDEGLNDIAQDARRLYLRLKQSGVINLLKKHQRRGSSMTGFDNESVAQAILRLALEERGSLGAKNAYALIQRWR